MCLQPTEQDSIPKGPEVTTLRLPVFCRENKPFVFVKVMNHSEKYRISVNPEFLKNYSLNFKILRDQTLNNFMNNLKPEIKNIIKRGWVPTNPTNPTNHETSSSDSSFTNVSIYLKLPEKDKFPIQKHTMLLEHDGEPGRTLIDKYQIIFTDDFQDGESPKKNVLYIIERSYNGIRNVSITFISEQFPNLKEFLDVYNQKISS